MSLIADALKKADLPSGNNPPAVAPPPPEPSPWFNGITRGILIVGIGLVLLGVAHLTRRPASPAVALKPAVSAGFAKASAPAPSKASGMQLLQAAQAGLVLNGTILDNGGESLALINNQVLQEGDQIRNMRVVKVNTDSVELQDQDGRTKTLGLKN